MTRACSLHATHADLPSRASVIVGQYGPAPAQALNTLAPGNRPSAAADAFATRIPPTINETILVLMRHSVRKCAARFRPAIARLLPPGLRRRRSRDSR